MYIIQENCACLHVNFFIPSVFAGNQLHIILDMYIYHRSQFHSAVFSVRFVGKAHFSFYFANNLMTDEVSWTFQVCLLSSVFSFNAHNSDNVV